MVLGSVRVMDSMIFKGLFQTKFCDSIIMDTMVRPEGMPKLNQKVTVFSAYSLEKKPLLLTKEMTLLLTVLFPDSFPLNQPKVPPSPGRRAGQTYASADDPSASWHRVGMAVVHKKPGPHLLLTLKMLLSLSPAPALASSSSAVKWWVCILTCHSAGQPSLFSGIIT